MKKTSMLSGKTLLFSNTALILFRTYKINLLPNLLRSNLNNNNPKQSYSK